jgi:hypothetical protein
MGGEGGGDGLGGLGGVGVGGGGAGGGGLGGGGVGGLGGGTGGGSGAGGGEGGDGGLGGRYAVTAAQWIWRPHSMPSVACTCRIGHLVLIRQPSIRSPFHLRITCDQIGTLTSPVCAEKPTTSWDGAHVKLLKDPPGSPSKPMNDEMKPPITRRLMLQGAATNRTGQSGRALNHDWLQVEQRRV